MSPSTSSKMPSPSESRSSLFGIPSLSGSSVPSVVSGIPSLSSSGSVIFGIPSPSVSANTVIEMVAGAESTVPSLALNLKLSEPEKSIFGV